MGHGPSLVEVEGQIWFHKGDMQKVHVRGGGGKAEWVPRNASWYFWVYLLVHLLRRKSFMCG